MSNRSPVSQWGFVICELRLFLANGVYNNLRSLFLSVVEFVLSMSVFLLVRMSSISMCSNANFKLSENTQTRPAEFLFQFVCRFLTHESGWQDNSTISCPKCAHLWCWGFTWCDELTGKKITASADKSCTPEATTEQPLNPPILLIFGNYFVWQYKSSVLPTKVSNHAC